jgi:hypothetical protein
MPTLHEITLSVSPSAPPNSIRVEPDSLRVQMGDVVKFKTENADRIFQILIHNYDRFFHQKGDDPILQDEVTEAAPVSFTVNSPSPDHAVKYYSVCVLSEQIPLPSPPDAPPRIVVDIV